MRDAVIASAASDMNRRTTLRTRRLPPRVDPLSFQSRHVVPKTVVEFRCAVAGAIGSPGSRLLAPHVLRD